MTDSKKSTSSSTGAATPPIRIAMLGMIEGNGHPYSWSAIVNGFDAEGMQACPYPAIHSYLTWRPPESIRVPGAQVTHIWTDDPADAPKVAKASRIPNVVKGPEDVIGHVDGVMVAIDDGLDHVRRARPFIEAGVPVFVDKPLATSVGELKTFIDWQKAGARILSSSGLRYAPEFDPYLDGRGNLGELRWLCGVSIKTWERYGIHILEPMMRLLGPGFESVRLDGRKGFEIAHIIHKGGAQATIPVIYDGGAMFGQFQLGGMRGHAHVATVDTYTAFRRQMVSFIDYVRTGVSPVPFSETVELMTALIAGIRSREENGRRVALSEIKL